MNWIIKAIEKGVKEIPLITPWGEEITMDLGIIELNELSLRYQDRLAKTKAKRKFLELIIKETEGLLRQKDQDRYILMPTYNGIPRMDKIRTHLRKYNHYAKRLAGHQDRYDLDAIEKWTDTIYEAANYERP